MTTPVRSRPTQRVVFPVTRRALFEPHTARALVQAEQAGIHAFRMTWNWDDEIETFSVFPGVAILRRGDAGPFHLGYAEMEAPEQAVAAHAMACLNDDDIFADLPHQIALTEPSAALRDQVCILVTAGGLLLVPAAPVRRQDLASAARLQAALPRYFLALADQAATAHDLMRLTARLRWHVEWVLQTGGSDPGKPNNAPQRQWQSALPASVRIQTQPV